LKRLIIGVHKVPPTRVFAFTNEWDVPCFTIPQSGEKEEEDWILFFGNVEDYKGLEYLILAEPLITSEIPRAKIVIAGRGQEKYYHLIRNKDNFLLLNKFVDYEEGSVLIKKSKIIVLPYKTGTVSGVIPVAYAFKKPIVATRVGCFDEVIKHGETGVLVEPHNPTELARALVYLLKDDELRRKLGEKGFEKLKRELSWDVFVSKLMVIYQKLISRRNRRSDSKTKMLIKRATILDLHKVYSFYEKISLDATTSFFYRRVLPRSHPRIYFITRIALNITIKKEIFAILLSNGSVIGLSHILVSRNKRHGEEGIVLLKGHRGKGLGRLLLFYSIKEAKREGLKALWAAIDVDNYPSIKLHRKLGFRILKVMPGAGSRYGRPVDMYL
jgi:RimJ/RimL family protein N-acetyltransferase